jgi:hypothetical protein
MSVTINVREAGNVTIVEVAGRVTLGAAGPSIQGSIAESMGEIARKAAVGESEAELVWRWSASPLRLPECQ